MEDDKYCLKLVRQAAIKIEKYLGNMELKDFLSDDKTQSAVIMQFIVIGELANKVTEKTREEIKLPWQKIIGFRNLAVHEYFYLDLEKIWDTAKENLSELNDKINKFL